MMDASKSNKSVLYTFMMLGLVLKGGEACVFISCIDPIILIISLMIHAPDCNLFAASLFLMLPPNMLLHVALLKLVLEELFVVL